MLKAIRRITITPIVTIILFFTIITCLSKTANAVNNSSNQVEIKLLNETATELKLSFNLNSYQAIKIDDHPDSYAMLMLDDAPYLETAGKPVLPFISRSILLPLEGVVSIEIGEVSRKIEPALRPVMAVIDDVNSNELTSESSDNNDIWPPNPVEIGGIAILRGYRLLSIRMYPFQFDPITCNTIVNEHIEFRLNIDGATWNSPSSPRPEYVSISAWKAVSQLVENPPLRPDRDLLKSANYLYIIPRFNGIEDVIAPLIEWRIRQGHRVSVEYVANNANRGVIGDLIEDAYQSEHPVEFVALVGDAGNADFVIPASTNTGDYQYTLLDGNDELPDVAIGRISCDNLGQLELIVNKLVSYESTPYMEDTEWYKNGAVVAGHIGNGLGSVLVAKYVKQNMYKLGFEDVRSWLHNEDGEIPVNRAQPFLAEVMDWGITLLSYRAYQLMNRLPIAEIMGFDNRDGRWPVVLAISCNTGDFVNGDGHTEAFLRSRGGGIGAIGTCTAQTNVRFNNIMAAGTFKGMYLNELHTLGWGMNYGKYELWRAYDGLENTYRNFMDWNNLMGDPGTHIWTDIPRTISVTHDESISLGQSSYTVHVANEEDGSPESQTLVCLYKLDDLHAVAYTNEDGIARFTFSPDALNEGEIMLTVSKHNVYPYLTDLEVTSEQNYLGISEYEIDDDDAGNSDGNDDGLINPGEQIEIYAELKNFGERELDGEVSVQIISSSPYLEVINESIILDEAPTPGNSELVVFVIGVDPACPNLNEQPFEIITRIDVDVFSSGASFDINSPATIITNIAIPGGVIRPGDRRRLDIHIENMGRQNLDAFHATLSSDSDMITLMDVDADYQAIDIGDNDWADGEGMQFEINSFAIPGAKFDLQIDIETEDGFRDTLEFSITLAPPANSDPFGPDEYGYYCFDSGDNDWEIAPEYNWIEIDPRIEGNHFNGNVLDLSDPADNQDESIAIVMPFPFQYYVQEFDTLTICTNGWAAFGNQAELAAFRNRHIGQALGPDAHLSVWWDNLITTNNSSILTYHDEESGKFIIEWSRMQRLNMGGGGATETFQIILFDPEFVPTYSGDGIIKYQYKDIENQPTRARNDTPYCTIGISNLDDTDGLEYTYWNGYPSGATRIADEMAIIFTTASSSISGVIRGSVRDAASGEPIANALVNVSQGGTALTDDEGNYLLDVLIGNDYFVTASASGWNDSTLIINEVAEDDTLDLDFGLLYSAFSISHEQIEERLDPDEMVELELTISNDGNGMLSWSVESEFDEGESGIGRRNYSFLVGNEVDDLNMGGVAYVGDRIYVTGRNGNDANQVYVLDEEGNLISQFDQPGEGNTGILDLTYADDLLWGSGERQIYGMNTVGEVVTSFRGPFPNNKCITYDPDQNGLWIFAPNNSLRAINFEGRLITSLPNKGLNITGLAYNTEDPDGFNLYLLVDKGQRRMSLMKMNTATGDTISLSALEPGQPVGLFLANDFAGRGSSIMVMVNDALNDEGDRLDIWQLGTDTGWMSLDVENGSLLPESSSAFNITLNTQDMFPAVYNADLVFSHSGPDSPTIIPVSLMVNELAVKDIDSQLLPLELTIDSVYPNPFNSSSSLSFQVPERSMVNLSVWDMNGRRVSEFENQMYNPGNYSVTINAQSWSSGIYFVTLKAGEQTRMKKLVCLK